MPAKVDLAPGQFIVGGVVCDQNTPKEHIDYYMEQSNRELAMMYPYKVEPLNTDHIPPGPEALKTHIRDDSVRKLYPGMVVVPGGWIPDEDRTKLEKDFVIIDRSIPTRKGMPPAVFEDKEK